MKNIRFKTTIGFLAVIIAIFTAIFFYQRNRSPQNPPPPLDKITANDYWRGDANASAILIEYSDFQCPACSRYGQFLQQLTQDQTIKVRLVYRHFPLTQIHPRAQLAAQAAEAAGQQNEFWRMHDLLFANQNEWANANDKKAAELFIQYAQDLNLDLKQFKNDLRSKTIKNKIKLDYASGIIAGVNATPTLFLNGQKIELPRTYEELKQQIINQ